MVGGVDQHLNRVGLSRAALKTAILADNQGVEALDEIAEVIASAVADAIEANNEEILRQLRDLLAPRGADCTVRCEIQPDRNQPRFLARATCASPFRTSTVPWTMRIRPTRDRFRKDGHKVTERTVGTTTRPG
jgi:hypothetical protein